MDGERLLPCPFCGGEAYISTPVPGKGVESGNVYMFVECRICGAHPYSVYCFDPKNGTDSLVERWNRRAEAKPLKRNSELWERIIKSMQKEEAL